MDYDCAEFDGVTLRADSNFRYHHEGGAHGNLHVASGFLLEHLHAKFALVLTITIAAV